MGEVGVPAPSGGYNENNIFAKILRKEIPSQSVYEDEQCLAFRDVHPQAPTHILVIPKAPISQLRHTTAAHEQLLGHLLVVAGKVAMQEKLEHGYRIVINDGQQAGQTVYHLHVHVIGGRHLAWPPG